jgi:hypothetical protein
MMRAKKRPPLPLLIPVGSCIELDRIGLSRYYQAHHEYLQLKNHEKPYPSTDYVPHEVIVKCIPAYTTEDLLDFIPNSISFKTANSFGYSLNLTKKTSISYSVSYSCDGVYTCDHDCFSECPNWGDRDIHACSFNMEGGSLGDALSKMLINLWEQKEVINWEQLRHLPIFGMSK